MIRLILALTFIAGLLCVAAGLFTYSQMANIQGPLTEEKITYIAPGTSVRGMAEQLAAEGAIDASWVFRAAARLNTADGSLKAGEYLIPAGASVKNILSILQSGKTHLRKITIAEGLMSFEIMGLVNAAEALEGNVTDIPPEGSLLPETYTYSRGDDRQKLIARMQKDMETTLATLWETRTAELPVKTPQEALILASVVEKETGVAAERARVAGVFINRIKTGMPLQSDPTVIYAVTEGKYKLERPIYRTDLGKNSPYNTYLVPGLPPTPIANPGKAALAAVLNPEAHDYLYFVADGTGGHSFGKTLSEHNRNVDKWREIEKSQK